MMWALTIAVLLQAACVPPLCPAARSPEVYP